MAYQTITEPDGDQYRIHRLVGEDGNELVRLELRKSGYPVFELLWEGIPKYIVDNQY